MGLFMLTMLHVRKKKKEGEYLCLLVVDLASDEVE
jgi:hypothetical protein